MTMFTILSRLTAIIIFGFLASCSSSQEASELEVGEDVVAKSLGFTAGTANPGLYIVGLSHLNIIVSDVDYATEFYGRTLGFVQAHNVRGPMDYKGYTGASFARDAGFLDGNVKVDIRFLKHPTVGMHIELMKYHQPIGSQEVIYRNTNDLGGIRHVALEVSDAEKAFDYLKEQPDVKMINESSDYGPPEALGSGRIKFFYWLDPWGVQWEMEEGRPIGDIRGISG